MRRAAVRVHAGASAHGRICTHAPDGVDLPVSAAANGKGASGGAPGADALPATAQPVLLCDTCVEMVGTKE